MIGYVCKYTPIEIFEAFGETTQRISPNEVLFDHADAMMHANMCFYAKGVLEEMLKEDYDGLILTSCCDSIRRLYDVLKQALPEKFIYLLDVPRKVNELSCNYYKKQMLEMCHAYEAYSGKTLDEDKLLALLHTKAAPKAPDSSALQIGILGARCPEFILKSLQDASAEIAWDNTCTGINRYFSNISRNHLMADYALGLLSLFPCLRMADTAARQVFLTPHQEHLDGIIYHTVKFCDNYSYEYARLKKQLTLPILKLETDYSMQCEGQIKTRVEAFIESLKTQQMKETTVPSEPCTLCYGTEEKAPSKEAINQMKTAKEIALRTALQADRLPATTTLPKAPAFVLGIDSGSTSTNVVILNEQQKLIAYHIVRTGAKSGESAQRALDEVLDKAHLHKEDLKLIVSTGYGRVSIPFAQKHITEISCHGKGAHFINPKIRTILDIGGQDSKAIKLNDKGEVIDFVMNDKCAAGTGRFLEMMARSMEVDLKEMGPLSLKSKEDITISSMCSVFAESEVISLVAQNKEKADIIHGIHKGIATKSAGLISRVGKQGDYMMTGGVAQNVGAVKAIEEKLGAPLFIPEEPEIIGALGAALFALESIS